MNNFVIFQEYVTPDEDPVYTPPDFVYKSMFSVHTLSLTMSRQENVNGPINVDHYVEINLPHGENSDRELNKCSIFFNSFFDNYDFVVYISENCLVHPGTNTIEAIKTPEPEKFVAVDSSSLGIARDHIIWQDKEHSVLNTEFFILPQQVRQKIKDQMQNWRKSNNISFDRFLTQTLLNNNIACTVSKIIRNHEDNKKECGLNNFLNPYWYARSFENKGYRPKISYYPNTHKDKEFQVEDYNRLYL